MNELLEDGCQDPAANALLTTYCFGGISEAEQEAVEAHLLGCERCWRELQRLETSVRVLRAGVLKPAVPMSEAASVFGLSGRLDRPFGGHRPYVLGVATLFGVEWTLGLWTELGYSYDRFGTYAWALSLPVGTWVVASLLLALSFDTKATRAGDTRGLIASTMITTGTLGLLTITLMLVLPAERTILAAFQTRTASSGYFKDVLFIFLPLLAFILPTFHSIIRLQRELKAGRHGEVFDFLSRRPDSVGPRQLLYLSPKLLGGFLLVYGVVKVVGANRMLDALNPGPYANLFTVASYISTGVWFAIPIVSLAWYSSNLNELKRECAVLTKLDSPQRREVNR